MLVVCFLLPLKRERKKCLTLAAYFLHLETPVLPACYPLKSKAQCCKKQHCIGIWNVRSMNQGKLEVVKQEMKRVNTDILGISKIKWTGMGEFNSDDHYIYYCGQESLRRNGVAITVNKSLKCSMEAISKMTQ